MRAEILTYLSNLKLTPFAVSQELPWDSQTQPLYLKNLKKIYLDSENIEESVAVPVMNGVNIQQETTTVRVYLATDAKNLPSQYDSTVDKIRASKDISTITGVNRRDCQITRTLQNDILLTEFEFQFSKLI